MRRPLPSLDQIARALLVQGARDAAVDLMEAVVARGGEERPRCEALLAAVRARPTDRVSGPPIALDAALVESLAAHGRLVEAWAVTRGAKVGHTVAGVEIAQALSLVMDPEGLDEPWLTRWTAIVASGNAADIAAIEREVVAGAPVPPPMLDRMRIAWRLLRGFWSSATSESSPGTALDPQVRARVSALLTSRELAAALEVLREVAGREPATLPVAMALARLISAAERMMAEETPRQASTLPLGGAGLALFQLRMGNFEEAERLLRRLVVEEPQDHIARDRLADVIVLRRALDPASPDDNEPLELAKTPAPDWLNKKASRASVEGWAAPPKAPARASQWEDDGETSVIRPDEEAELHAKSGHPERAIPIYEMLVARYPGRPRFQERLAELRATLERRREPIDTDRPTELPDPGWTPLAGEPTQVAPALHAMPPAMLPAMPPPAMAAALAPEIVAARAAIPPSPLAEPSPSAEARVTVRPILRVG